MRGNYLISKEVQNEAFNTLLCIITNTYQENEYAHFGNFSAKIFNYETHKHFSIVKKDVILTIANKLSFRLFIMIRNAMLNDTTLMFEHNVILYNYDLYLLENFYNENSQEYVQRIADEVE